MHRLPELDDALQDLSEVLGRRLVVVDESMRVVAYSIHESPADRRRLSHLLAHSDSWPSPQTGMTPYSIEQRSDVGTNVFLRLLDAEQHIIGHLVIPVNAGEASENAARIAQATVSEGAGRLGNLLESRRRAADERAARSHQHTVDLVSGTPQQREAAAAELLSDRMLSTSEHYCAVALGVDPREATPQDHEKASLAVARTVRFVNETSTATVVGGTLDDHVGVLVFPRPVVVQRLVRILERPPVARVRAGIGPLTELRQVHRSFERARLAWRASWLAPEDHPIVITWDQAGLDGTLARLPVETFTPDDLPPMTRDLLEHVESPNLILTLEAYLVAGGDAQRTAVALNIHRSTVYYRLDKLRTVIPGDLRDGIQRRELHTGLRIARLANLLPSASSDIERGIR